MLSILIGSFNTYKQYPFSNIDLSPWLIPKSHIPNLIVIGLQELSLNFSLFEQKSEYQWKKLIGKTLPDYQLLSHARLNGIKYFDIYSFLLLFSIGLLLLIYIQPSHLSRCSSISSAKVPTVG